GRALLVDRLERLLERVEAGEGGGGVDAGLGQDVLAVVDRARLGEPGDGPRAVVALELGGVPDAGGVGARAADLADVAREVLEPAERGEERHLGGARLGDVRAGAADRGVADAVE